VAPKDHAVKDVAVKDHAVKTIAVMDRAVKTTAVGEPWCGHRWSVSACSYGKQICAASTARCPGTCEVRAHERARA